MRAVIATVMFLVIGVLAVSLISKVRGRGSFLAFADALAGMKVIPAGWARPVAGATIAAEAVVLALLVWPGGAVAGLAAATLLFGGFTAALFTAVRRGTTVGCHCFGATSAPVARRHVARSGFLLAASLGALCGALAVSTRPLSGMPAPQLLIALTTAAIVVVVLVRLDDLAWLFRGATHTP